MFENGKFFTGCNYWASHAGMRMWEMWDDSVVDADFARLAKNNIRVLRVFPLWSDFQPIHLLRMGGGEPKEYRFGEEALPEDKYGAAGVSKVMLDRFRRFAELAEKHGLSLIVGIVTGWMSGRLFVPPALEGRNVHTDPVSMMWQRRFVKCFVDELADCPAIVAWDLGNECNCMNFDTNREQAYVWTAMIADTIRASDAVRPIVSGMHSLRPDGAWTAADQGELTDVLCTHPYPYFVAHCDDDAADCIRTEIAPTAETVMYRGLGGKPCFCEELGTLGPMFMSDEVGAKYIENQLWTLWAHDGLGLLWWCANEQSHLTFAPYDWNSVERELGLFYADGSEKPVTGVMREFTDFVDRFGTLPPRTVDAVCLLTPGQDTWKAGYMAFLLAKQAGLDIEFRSIDQPIPEAKAYFVPSICGDAAIPGHRMKELLGFVENGATLYISIDSGLLSPFTSYSGVKVLRREKAAKEDQVVIGGRKLPLLGRYKLQLEAKTAEVLATDENGAPVFTRNAYGKGAVYFLDYPVEFCAADQVGAFRDGGVGYHAVYEAMKRDISTDRAFEKTSVDVTATEHPVSDTERIVVVINHDPEKVTEPMKLNGWAFARAEYGEVSETSLTLNPNSAAVFRVVKK